MAADLHLPHQLPGANKTLTAQCHCKSVHFTVTVPTSALPLPVHLCHCSICRFTHGTLSSVHAPLPRGVEPAFVAPSSLETSLTGYVHSARAASERFFCATCGCHVGDRDLHPDPATGGTPEWRVATSVFAAHDEDTFQIRSHCFTAAATQPDLATWLPSINGRLIHVWNPDPDDPRFPLAAVQPAVPPPAPERDGDGNGDGDEGPQALDDVEFLTAQCHCGGVRFSLPARPSAAEASDPLLARFLQPSATPHRPSSSSTSSSSSSSAAAADKKEGEEEAGADDDPFARATGPAALKRVACLCLCRDCRLVSGAHAVAWTFVPLASLRPAVPRALEGFGTLRCYRSSGNVRRGFCGVCGATVFYAVDDPERVSSVRQGNEGVGKEGGEEGTEEETVVVDVAVGILRHPTGKVALEEWLTWRTGRLAGWDSGSAFDGGFADGLAKGLAEWGVKRYGRVANFNIPEE